MPAAGIRKQNNQYGVPEGQCVRCYTRAATVKRCLCATCWEDVLTLFKSKYVRLSESDVEKQALQFFKREES